MIDREPTVSARHLGRRLARVMREKGLRAVQVAAQLGWSDGRVSRLLSGKRTVPLVDIAAFLAICGVTGPCRDTLLTLAERALKPGWTHEPGESMPADISMLEDIEDSAKAITCYDVAAVPALLQTKDYQRWLIESNPVVHDEDIDDRISSRVNRQHILDRVGPGFYFFLDERIFMDSRPGRETMSDQVHHLLKTDTLAWVSIRVVPATSTLYGSCPSFQLMSYADLNPVVYIEQLNSMTFMEQPATIRGYRRVVDELDTIALGTEESRFWLAELVAPS